MDLDQWSLNLILGFFIPLVTAFVTKTSASAAIKGFVTLTLSVLVTSLTVFVSDATDMGGAHLDEDWLREFVQTYATAIVSYYGLTRHTVAGALHKATAGVGVGGHLPAVVDAEVVHERP